MKKVVLIIVFMFNAIGYSQIDKEQLALKVSKIEEANNLKLKEFI